MKKIYYLIIGIFALLLICNNVNAYPTVSGLTDGKSWQMVSLVNNSIIAKNCSETHYFENISSEIIVLLDQYQNLTQYGYKIYSSRWLAQTFKPLYTNITNTSIYLRKVGNPTGNLMLRVCNEKYGKPDLTHTYVSILIDSSTLSSSYSWVDFDFEDFIPETGANLSIVLNLTGGSYSLSVEVSFKGSNPYSNGTLVSSSNAGSTWNIYTTYDITFRTYGYNDTTPVITTYNWDDANSTGVTSNDLYWWNHTQETYDSVTNWIPSYGYWIYIYDLNYTFKTNFSCPECPDIDESMNNSNIVNLTLNNESWVNVNWSSWFNDSVIDTLETILSIDSQYINTTTCNDVSFSGSNYTNITDGNSWFNVTSNWQYNWLSNTFQEWLNETHHFITGCTGIVWVNYTDANITFNVSVNKSDDSNTSTYEIQEDNWLYLSGLELELSTFFFMVIFTLLILGIEKKDSVIGFLCCFSSGFICIFAIATDVTPNEWDFVLLICTFLAIGIGVYKAYLWHSEKEKLE